MKSEFASKSEQIQFLCKITEYVIEQCSSLMEENQENMMVTTTRQVEISAGMGRSGTKVGHLIQYYFFLMHFYR